jgi:hypothetical protein
MLLEELLKWARAAGVIGKNLLESAIVFAMLLGVVMLFVVVVGSC